MDAIWSIIDADLAAWTGYFGDTATRWGNGFYADCRLLDASAAILVDSRSTASLVSKKLFLSTKEMRPQPIFMIDKESGRAFMKHLEAGRVLTFLRGSLMTLSTWLRNLQVSFSKPTTLIAFYHIMGRTYRSGL